MTLPRKLGVLLQALLLGLLLFFAVSKLIATETEARVFRYQMY